MNYWEYNLNGTDRFADLRYETDSWNMPLVRIGGNYANTTANDPYSQTIKNFYVTAIQNVQASGAIALVQLPIDLNPTQVGEWMDYFNLTRNLGIVYWAIGNEPDPSSGLNDWYTGAPGGQHDGRNYTGFRGQFRIMAKKIKEKDPNSIICGPDFRMWYGNANDASSAQGSPFGTYYRDFLYGGTNPVGTDDYNGDPIIDIFVLHFYGDGGGADFDEGDFIDKYGQMMQLINATNAVRAANGQSLLKIAVGEYNDANPKGFRAGQRMAIMAKQSLKNGAVFMTPWSISEGTDYYPMISKGNDLAYSTAHHWKMMSQNVRGSFMNSQENLNENNNIVSFGMKDNDGYTILLINEGNNNYTFSVNFSPTPGAYNPANTQLKFRFDANEPNAAFSGVTLYANSTIMYTYNNNGERLRKTEYRTGYAAPTVYDFPVTNTAPTVNLSGPANNSQYPAPASITLTANANDSDGNVTQVAFYQGGNLLGIDYNAPYAYTWNNVAAGTYTLTAVATDDDAATTTSAGVAVTVNAAASGLTSSYYYLVNKLHGDYMRPLGGSNTTNTDVVVYDLSDVNFTYSSFQWEFNASQNAGYHQIVNKYTTQGITPVGADPAAGTAMYQRPAANNWNSMQWLIEPSNETGFYWIKNRKSDLYLRPDGGQNATAGNTVILVQDVLVPAYSSFKWALDVAGPRAGARRAFGESEEGEALAPQLTFYPNPAAKLVFLSEKADWELFDVSGKRLQAGQGDLINVSQLANGFYLLRAQGQTHRLLIQR
jgi:hypothetical protein